MAEPDARIPLRLERLPLSGFHYRALATVGVAHLFDAFDSLIIAFVLPSLILQWHISPVGAGLLVAIGYVGQLIGAITLSGLAERIGRRKALRISLFIVSILSLACASASSFAMLVTLRFLQGIGLGGEVPIAASYLNELSPSRVRGRIVYILQGLFALGTLVAATAARAIIPAFGWQALFLLGTFPLILAIFLNRLIPESPRWLAAHGRSAEAEALVSGIEAGIIRSGRSLPAVDFSATHAVAQRRGGLRDLLARDMRTRTLSTWAIAFCLSLAAYGLLTWMPTLYVSVYKLPLETALGYALVPTAIGIIAALLGASLIDRVGRRNCFLIGFGGGAIPLLVMAFLLPGAFAIMLLTSAAMFFMTLLISGIYLYAPEVYPTEIRALGTGVATAWMRLASIVAPLMIGTLLSHIGVSAVFLLLAVASLIGLIVVFMFAVETRGRVLEDISH